MVKEERLTIRQERFVHEYLIDGVGSRAAVAAGYSPKTAEHTASVTIRIPKVARRLEALKSRQLQRVDFSADDVLKELIELATMSFDDFIDDQGYLVGNLKDVPKAARRCISEIVQETTSLPGGGTQVRLKLKLHDRIKALALLGKHISIQAYEQNINIEVRTLADTVAELKRRRRDGDQAEATVY